MPLTDLRARKAQPGERDYKLADEKGLHLLVRPNGSKLWRLKYRFAGKERQLAFGPYPEVSLAQARDLRDNARRALRSGADPMDERRRAERERTLAAANSFRTIADEWFALNSPRWATGHAERVERSFERDVHPTIGDTAITAIDTPMLLDLLRAVERRGSIETAKRVRQRISAVFVYGISRGAVTADPAAVLEKALQRKPKVRPQPALLDLTELRALIDKTERSGASPVTLLASRLLALTAVRPGVVRHARWVDFRGIDFEAGTSEGPYWHVPSAAMKLAQDRKSEEAFDHIVPLAPAAVDALLAVHPLTGRAPYVFPGQRHAHDPMSENAIGYLYNRSGWAGRHVPHGWRAAFSTIMNEQAERAGVGGDRAVIDLMLAHVPKDKVESAYNRAQFAERRREIAEAWAALLMEGTRPAGDLLSLARRSSSSS